MGETKLSSDRPRKLSTDPRKVGLWRHMVKLLIDEGCIYLPFLNSGVTDPTFTKFLHNVASPIIVDETIEIDLQYFTPFRNAMATKVSQPWVISPILTLKLVAMATSLERATNDGQIGNLRSNTYHMVKNW